MPDPLSREEIDALLSLARSTGEPREPAAAAAPAARPAPGRIDPRPPTEVRIHDFRRPERVSKSPGIALETLLATLHEVFARNLSETLSASLRHPVEVRLVSAETVSYSGFTMSLPIPTSFHAVSCEPLGGRMVLEVNPSILHPIIDRQLGGGRVGALSLDRPSTEIELALADTILERILRALRETWESVKEIEFRVLAGESNPFLLEVVPPDERVVLLGFEVRMDGHAGRMHLCIPLTVIEPIRSELSRGPGTSAGRSRGDGECREWILEGMADAPIELTAVLAETRLSLYDLLTLRPGDILSTGRRRSSPVAISIEGRKRFSGEGGAGEAGRVVRVERRDPDR